MFAHALWPWRTAWLALLGACLLVPSGQAQGGPPNGPACLPRQYYSPWEPDPTFVTTWKCYYFYATDLPQCRYECQVCYWHNTDGYRDWVYFYNPRTGRFWGKCASPSHCQYQPDKPVWARSGDNGVTWGPLMFTPPPVPVAGNIQVAISSPPVPPTP
jgi:hypothetical protein